MKLILQTVLCCSLLLTFTLTVETTKLRLSSEMKKRLNAWPQNRVRRDLSSPVDAEQFVRPEDVSDSLNPHMSTDISIRAKRSKNSVSQTKRASSCSLSTCAMNNLMDRLSKLSNQMRIGNVPINKTGPTGYGRRRRSLPASQGSPRLHRGRNSHARSLEVLLRRTRVGSPRGAREGKGGQGASRPSCHGQVFLASLKKKRKNPTGCL